MTERVAKNPFGLLTMSEFIDLTDLTTIVLRGAWTAPHAKIQDLEDAFGARCEWVPCRRRPEERFDPDLLFAGRR